MTFLYYIILILPVNVITDHGLFVLIFHTRIVLSWLPLTILAQSNWIQEIAAEWPSKVRTWHCPFNQDFLNLNLSLKTFLQDRPIWWCLSSWKIKYYKYKEWLNPSHAYFCRSPRKKIYGNPKIYNFFMYFFWLWVVL